MNCGQNIRGYETRLLITYIKSNGKKHCTTNMRFNVMMVTEMECGKQHGEF